MFQIYKQQQYNEFSLGCVPKGLSSVFFAPELLSLQGSKKIKTNTFYIFPNIFTYAFFQKSFETET